MDVLEQMKGVLFGVEALLDEWKTLPAGSPRWLAILQDVAERMSAYATLARDAAAAIDSGAVTGDLARYQRSAERGDEIVAMVKDALKQMGVS